MYLEEVPLLALGHFQSIDIIHCISYIMYSFVIELTGHEPGRTIIFNFEYGKDFSGPGLVIRCDTHSKTFD